jgi:SM-20-related protein
MNLETALEDFKSKSYFVWDDFLTPEEITIVMADYREIYKAGSFKLAGLGNKEGPRNVNSEIRTDETYWLDPNALTSRQSVLWNHLEVLKNVLNERFFLGLWTLEGHYSHYPSNGFYRKHIDRFSNDDQRTVSTVIYLNPTWNKGDGGELRIHEDNSSTVDIAPRGGRLVCFLSSKIVHEVLTSHKTRHSFAGWWKKRAR